MGRWKRKREYYAKRKKSSNDEEEKINKAFALLEMERVKVYLREYRDACYQVFHGKNPNNDGDEVIIDCNNFPALTPEVLSRPFLALPSTLSGKQRRFIHELATSLDLFHESIGVERENRYIVVSIYSDGFKHLATDAIMSSRPSIPFRHCKPWFCRAENDVQLCTEHGRKQIESLMDQPGDCLRDNHDCLDYKSLDGMNLSTFKEVCSSDGDDFWMLVDSEASMKQCARELLEAGPTELAFDLEYYNPSKYLQVTCLLQLSSNLGKDYVIDTLALGVWDQVPLLRPLFANANIVKIGHSISGDVQSLHRDFGIFVVNAFDTFEAAKVMNLTHKGLASVCQHFGLANSEEYLSLKDTYQATDWRQRPLTEPMVRYGRYDVHYLVLLRKLFMRDMTKGDLWDSGVANQEPERIAQSLVATLRSIAVAEGDVDDDDLARDDDDKLPESNLSDDDDDDDNNDENGFYTPQSESDGPTERKSKVGAKELRMQPILMQTISASQQQCLGLWTVRSETLSKSNFYGLLIKQAQNGEIEWTNSHGNLLEALMEWRTRIAAKEECLEGLVCSLDFLISFAVKRPCNETALRRIKYYLPEVLEDPMYRDEMLSIVRLSLARDGIREEVVDIPSYSSSTNRGINVPGAASGPRWTKLLMIASAAAVVLVVGFVIVRRVKR